MKTFTIDPCLKKENLYDVLEFIFETKIEKQTKITVGFDDAVIDYSFVLPQTKQLVFVNYNDYSHFVDFDNFRTDSVIVSYCDKNNIRLVEIPYYIQLTNETIIQYFGNIASVYLKNKQVKSIRKSGFYENNRMPYRFNSYGTFRFLSHCFPGTQVRNGDEIDESFTFEESIVEIYDSIWWDKPHKEQELMRLFLQFNYNNYSGLHNGAIDILLSNYQRCDL